LQEIQKGLRANYLDTTALMSIKQHRDEIRNEGQILETHQGLCQ